MIRAPSRMRLSMPERLLVAILVLGLLALCTWGIYSFLTSRAPILVWDFHPPWLGLRAMVLDGSDPYSRDVTLAIQEQMLGRPAHPDEDQNAFVYPLYLLVLIGPLALLPLPLAQALWFTVLGASLLELVFLGSRAVRWRPRPWLFGLTVLFALGLYSNVWAVLLGQISIVTAAFVALCWWGLRTERWTLAGVSLALSTIKPQIVFLFVPGVLAWAAFGRHWRLLITFFATLGLLFLLPMPWLPTWPLEWLGAMDNYAGYTAFEPLLIMIFKSPWLAGIAASLLLAWSLYIWWHTPNRLGAGVNWVLGMLLVISALIAPRTSHVNQTVLLLPLFFVFSKVPRAGIIVAAEVLLLLAPWTLDLLFAPVAGVQHTIWQHRVISPILPLGLTLALLFLAPRPTRRRVA